MTCETHAKQRERMRKMRLDPEFRARELEQQRGYKAKETTLARRRELYADMSGQRYNKLLLRNRRSKALARMAKRHVPKEKEA